MFSHVTLLQIPSVSSIACNTPLHPSMWGKCNGTGGPSFRHRFINHLGAPFFAEPPLRREGRAGQLIQRLSCSCFIFVRSLMLSTCKSFFIAATSAGFTQLMTNGPSPCTCISEPFFIQAKWRVSLGMSM